jgi:predicted transglutaminase-like cysteine proteinase
MPTHHGSWPGDLSVPQPGEFAIELGAQNKDAFGKRYNSSGMTAADISAKWNELQSRILADEAAVAACRASQAACTLATRQFLSIVDLGAQCEGRMRLGWINRAVNMTVRPVSDWVNGYGDFWASPLQTLGSGAGDCQDYAIVKLSRFADLEFPLMISVSLSCKMKNVKRGTLPSQFATCNVG